MLEAGFGLDVIDFRLEIVIIPKGLRELVSCLCVINFRLEQVMITSRGC